MVVGGVVVLDAVPLYEVVVLVVDFLVGVTVQVQDVPL